MNRQQWPVLHHQQQRQDYRNFGPYPGGGAGGYPAEGYGWSPQQYGASQLPTAVTPASPSSGGGLLGNFNLKDIKTIVDRMGGIDGVISTVGKVQKIVSSIQQMQPMLKLLFSMLPGKSKSGSSDDDDDNWQRPRRRRRRRRTRRKGKRKAYTRSTMNARKRKSTGPYHPYR